MKHLSLLSVILFTCGSLFAGVTNGKYTGKIKGKILGKGNVEFTETREIKDNVMTITVAKDKAESKTYTLKLAFTADDFFKIESPDVTKGGGYCFNSYCHYGGESKDGYFDIAMTQTKVGMFLTGSVYDSTTKDYMAFHGFLKPVTKKKK